MVRHDIILGTRIIACKVSKEAIASYTGLGGSGCGDEAQSRAPDKTGTGV